MIQATGITSEIIEKAYSYSGFNALTESLWKQGETTNGINTESQLNYTKLNIQRTKRWDKRGELFPETEETIKAIGTRQIWFVITEGWCGDSAQILPFINKMAELNANIELKIVLRDEYPEIMGQFLTNGKSRSIPKVIILDTDTLEVLGDWGPRPLETQMRYMQERANPEIGDKKATENLHIWYARNKGVTVQAEFTAVITSLK